MKIVIKVKEKLTVGLPKRKEEKKEEKKGKRERKEMKQHSKTKHCAYLRAVWSLPALGHNQPDRGKSAILRASFFVFFLHVAQDTITKAASRERFCRRGEQEAQEEGAKGR